MGITGLGAKACAPRSYDLERLGIASNDTALTAFVHIGVRHSSFRRLQEAEALGNRLDRPHARIGARSWKRRLIVPAPANCRAEFAGSGLRNPLPERLWRILRGIANDGRGESGAGGSLSVRKQDADTARVKLRREWRALEETARSAVLAQSGCCGIWSELCPQAHEELICWRKQHSVSFCMRSSRISVSRAASKTPPGCSTVPFCGCTSWTSSVSTRVWRCSARL